MNLKTLLQNIDLPLLEKRMLIEHVLEVPRSWLITHDMDELEATQITKILDLVKRRQQGEPIAYLIGQREFMGLNFKVTPDVLIPRPDTEILVEVAVANLEQQTKRASELGQACLPRVLDLGTGSGIIAISIKYAKPKAQVCAVDVSEAALNIARQNANHIGVDVVFVQSDWFKGLNGEKFDLIVSNPPYISLDDPHLQQADLRFEPSAALTDQRDGLSAIRQIIQEAPRFLQPNAYLWLEHGWEQSSSVRQLFEQGGWSDIQSQKDLASIERITGACRPR